MFLGWANGQMVSAHRGYLATKHFGSLDGLRAFSILAVLWHHTMSGHFSDVVIARYGHYGVNLFLSLSGFLITTLLLREKDRFGDISLKKFFARRVLRILPLYYAVLGTYVALVVCCEIGPDASRAFFGNLPYYVLHLSNWFVELSSDQVIFYFAWSVALEQQFYLVWSALEKWASRDACLRVSIATTLLLFLISSLSYFGLGGIQASLSRCVPILSLASGVLLAHLLHRKTTFHLVARVLGWQYSSILSAATILAILWQPFFHEGLLLVAMTMLVGCCVIREDHHLAWILRRPVIKRFGQLSYAVYMTHMLVFRAVRELAAATSWANPFLVFLATVVGCFLVAELSFRYFESRFLNLKKRFRQQPDVAGGNEQISPTSKPIAQPHFSLGGQLRRKGSREDQHSDAADSH